MVSIANLSVIFKASTGRFKKDVRGAMRPLQRMKRVSAGLTGSLAKLAGGVFALGGAFRVLRGTVGLVMRSIRESMEFERIEVGLAALVKDGARAKILFKDLQKFALSTTFVFKDTLAASRTMIAFGENVENVIPTLAVLGNIAAGVNMPLQELAFIFEQSRVEGKLLQRDMRQFATRGIPIASEIAKLRGVTLAAIGDMTKKGEITFNDLAQAFKNLATAGGQYEGLMGAIAQTVSGRWERMKDQVQLLLKTIGDEIVTAFSLDVVLDRAFKKLQEFRENGKEAMRAIAEWFRDRAIVFATVVDMFFRGMLILGSGLLHLLIKIGESLDWVIKKFEKMDKRRKFRPRSLSAMSYTVPETGEKVPVSPHLGTLAERGFGRDLEVAGDAATGMDALSDALAKAAEPGANAMEFLSALPDVMKSWASEMPDLAAELKGVFAGALPDAEALTKELQRLAEQMKTDYDPFVAARKNMEAFFDSMRKKIDALDPKSLRERFETMLAGKTVGFQLQGVQALWKGAFDGVGAIGDAAQAKLSKIVPVLQRLSTLGLRGLRPEDAERYVKIWGGFIDNELKKFSEVGKPFLDGILSAFKGSFSLLKAEFDKLFAMAAAKKEFMAPLEKMFEELSKTLDLAEKAKRIKEILESIKTPQQLFADAANALKELTGFPGGLTADQLSLAMKKARDDILGTKTPGGTGRAVLARASEFGPGGGVSSSRSGFAALEKQGQQQNQTLDDVKKLLEGFERDGVAIAGGL